MKNVKINNKKKLVIPIALFLVLTLFLSSTGCSSSKVSLSPLLLIDINENTDQNRVRALNPKTLVEVIGKVPLTIGNRQISTMSKDGSKLAIVSWAKKSSKEAELKILDIEKWKIKKTGLKIKKAISRLAFGPDGNSLYWIQPSKEKIKKEIPKNYQLNRYEIKNKKLKVLTKFKSLFVPDRIHLMNTGKHIVVYGINIGTDKMAKGYPSLYTIDSNNGKVLLNIRLSGIKAGLTKITSDKNRPNYKSFKPGLTSFKEKNLMYLVHADSDKVTIVDMLKGTKTDKNIMKSKTTMIDTISNIFIATAQALPGAGSKSAGTTKESKKQGEAEQEISSLVLPTEKRADASSDGKYLYVVDNKYTFGKKKGKNVRSRVDSALQIIDTESMTQVAKLDLPINGVSISPDDRWLLLKHTYGVGSRSQSNGGFYVYDTQNREKKAHLQKKFNVNVSGFSPDSKYAYTNYVEGSMGGHNWKRILRVIDLETQKVEAKREVKGFAGDLFIPEKTAE